MFKIKSYLYLTIVGSCLAISGCKVPDITQRKENTNMPSGYNNLNSDTSNAMALNWRTFFKDKNLIALIDTAVINNQELNITLQEIEIARSEMMIRRGAIFPFVKLGGATGVEKVGTYTSQGAGDASADITPGHKVPEMLGDFKGIAMATWEVDIWKKLRNANKAAVTRYLSSVAGKNFVITNLVSEVAKSYYELVALDYQLAIVKQNIELQQNALQIVNAQKEASRATALAVQKFEAELYKSESMQFEIGQQIKVTENNLNFILGRYPQPIVRDTVNFLKMTPALVNTGIPSQLLTNRPDVIQAELELKAAKLDVMVARAEFLPSFGISAILGLQAFKPSYLLKLPESIAFALAGDLAGPLINKQAIKAEFYAANARQLQAMYNYERTVLNGYLEVSTQLSSISNLEKSYDLKSKQVNTLMQSILVANDLFKFARADYLEVLMTQRDALESRLELVETKKEQFTASIKLYTALGGGWK